MQNCQYLYDHLEKFIVVIICMLVAHLSTVCKEMFGKKLGPFYRHQIFLAILEMLLILFGSGDTLSNNFI